MLQLRLLEVTRQPKVYKLDLRIRPVMLVHDVVQLKIPVLQCREGAQRGRQWAATTHDSSVKAGRR